MYRKHLPIPFYVFYWLILVLPVLGIIWWHDGINFGQWLSFTVLAFLTVYLQSISVKLTQTVTYSLSTATVFPVIYLHGITGGIIVSLLSGLFDGLFERKSWDRIFFNMAQMTLCSIVGGLVFNRLGGSGVDIWYQGLIALSAGTLAYTGLNFLIISLLLAFRAGSSVWESIRTVGITGIMSSLGVDFVGVLFTLFAVAYGLGGIIVYGALLVYLASLLKTSVEISGERTMRVKLEEKLVTDEMTKAFNFRFLNNWFTKPLEDPVAVIFLDIDDFRNFNDQFGHDVGDQVLVTLTDTIKASVRNGDKVIRYGGDEFVILLPGQNGESAKVVAKRIQSKLAKLPFASTQPITISVGIASAPADATDKRQLLMAADQAMYRAKETGKDKICVGL